MKSKNKNSLAESVKAKVQESLQIRVNDLLRLRQAGSLDPDYCEFRIKKILSEAKLEGITLSNVDPFL